MITLVVILSKQFCTSAPNLVILAWIGDDIVRTNLVTDGRTDIHTHKRSQQKYSEAKTGFGWKLENN